MHCWMPSWETLLSDGWPSIPAERLSFSQCEEAVERNRVDLRGWDYLHVSRRQDATHGHVRAGEYVENWIDWEVHVEFWRMYRSSQFIYYRAAWEDLNVDRQNGRPRPEAPVLSVGSAIYTLTEIFDFLFRLGRTGHYPAGAKASISLENTHGRHLWINDPNLMPFSEERITRAQRIEISRTLTPDDFVSGNHKVSLSTTSELFEQFGWDADPSVLVGQQTRFLNRQSW
jgi:hypothetical protein